ncbi:hypothetical protein [Evansella tamaricis]|uniref:Uncharacterized protein n=1 Tax=Evansella tamaricis TaxID=2069301 RepID=A0ABS6JEQ6_9BACI|nr:hypothetical protein [Evansella tamaricis]MBU9712157.1 hypothetical protein [Evansella tamaricis]
MYYLGYPCFYVTEDYEHVYIQTVTSVTFSHIHIYINEQEALTVSSPIPFIKIKKHALPSGSHALHIIGNNSGTHSGLTSESSYIITIPPKQQPHPIRSHDFKPGDILVASDNKFGIPDGYMGHSVLIINEDMMLESDFYGDSISRKPISHFFKQHEWYAAYRPKEPTLGQGAVKWGLNYRKQYLENIKKGIKKPKFSFVPTNDMKELWKTIYCSKLVWLCYYHGSNYEFKKDGLWFSPQNLNDELMKDENFQLLYEHPKHSFKIEL